MIEVFNTVPNVLVNRKRVILTVIGMTLILPYPESSGSELHAKVKQFCHCSYRIRSCRPHSCLE